MGKCPTNKNSHKKGYSHKTALRAKFLKKDILFSPILNAAMESRTNIGDGFSFVSSFGTELVPNCSLWNTVRRPGGVPFSRIVCETSDRVACPVECFCDRNVYLNDFRFFFSWYCFCVGLEFRLQLNPKLVGSLLLSNGNCAKSVIP